MNVKIKSMLFTAAVIIIGLFCNGKLLAQQKKSSVNARSKSIAADNTLLLGGEWGCELDPLDVGIKENWAARELRTKVKLPGTTSTNKLGEATIGADKGYLTSAYRYIGPAWYQRNINIPAGWDEKQVTLYLERVLMRSTVWIDGKQVGGPIDYLGVPHQHLLGKLTPGKHIITVRVDNRNVLNAGLGKGHHYYDGMQTIWNGLVGRIELKATPAVSLKLVRFFPSFKNGTVGVETSVLNTTGKGAERPLRIIIKEKASQRIVAQTVFNEHVDTGRSIIKHALKLTGAPLPWDEFQPNLYQAEVILGALTQADSYRADIGFRDLSTDGHHLTINERPLLYRNNHDGCIFPLTGYPPTDVESWKRILNIYRKHGLNGIRFHSWTPPKAAFTAADELGLYIQSEHFWNKMDATPEMASFAREEMRASLDDYGNHPSNCYILYGNELGGDLNLYAKWLAEDRAYDPRHLYSVAAGRMVKGDDFTEYGVKMNWQAPFTDWDYSGYFTKTHVPDVPDITHELGQPVTHPNWKELEKYTGVLKPRNYENFREAAKQAGVEHQSAAFQKASGNINRLNYKYDIEALLRTPQSGGYSLLDMHDFPGQGEALVGWLDAFYDEKGFLTAKEFSRYGSATVPLVRLPKFVFTEGEILNIKAEVAHYGAATLPHAELRWSLRNDASKITAAGKFPRIDVPVGGVTKMGEMEHRLQAPSKKGEHLVLEFTIAGTSYSNSWDLWVFPKPGTQPIEANDIVITADVATAIKALDAGRKVLLQANQLGKGTLPGSYACFKPPFWSTSYSFSQQSNVMGAVVRNQHPALALFPTADVLDWQWQTLCADANDFDREPIHAWRDLPVINNANARGFVLKGFPAEYLPIVQPVHDFQRPVKVGTLFELKTKGGGKLLVCGYDIAADLDSRPVARQLRKSLLSYMASEKFTPEYEIDHNWIISTFEKDKVDTSAPAGYENAYLYIKAADRYPVAASAAPWDGKWDTFVRTDDGMQYTVTGSVVWADANGKAWAGTKMRIEIKIREAIGGILKVRFSDWNQAGRRGIVRSEDGQEQLLGAHEKGQWLEFPLRREDGLDGIIILEADVTSGPNLMITDIAIVPR